jgi:hypothetical protein
MRNHITIRTNCVIKFPGLSSVTYSLQWLKKQYQEMSKVIVNVILSFYHSHSPAVFNFFNLLLLVSLSYSTSATPPPPYQTPNSILQTLLPLSLNKEKLRTGLVCFFDIIAQPASNEVSATYCITKYAF